MNKAKATYEDAAKHFAQGGTVVLSSEDKNVHLTFNPEKVHQEFLEDITFGGSPTDHLHGQWFVIEKPARTECSVCLDKIIGKAPYSGNTCSASCWRERYER